MNHKGARGWLCALLLLASVLLTFGGNTRPIMAETERPDPTPTTSESTQQTVTSPYTAASNLVITVTLMVTTTSNATTTAISTLTSKLTTTRISETVRSLTILDFPNMWIVLILVLGMVFLFSLFLLFRSRFLGELNRESRLVAQLQSKEHGEKPSESVSSALKRLLELGFIQPKEYIEKKMLAERLEKKSSIEKLFEEGLISKEQYDALMRKEQD